MTTINDDGIGPYQLARMIGKPVASIYRYLLANKLGPVTHGPRGQLLSRSWLIQQGLLAREEEQPQHLTSRERIIIDHFKRLLVAHVDDEEARLDRMLDLYTDLAAAVVGGRTP